MNASPYKTLGDLGPLLDLASGHQPSVKDEPPGRDALQALLAFAALQQQVRNQRNSADTDSTSPRIDQTGQERFALDEVLQLVAERALAITRADGIAIALAEDGAIVCRAIAGTVTPDKGAKVNPNYGFSGACLSSGSTVRCDDAQIDARVNPDICRKLGTRSMVGVPLWAKQTVIGIIEAFASEAKRFTESDVRRLNLLAELLLAALQPEEEDRMAEVSRQVVRRSAPVEPIRRLPVKPVAPPAIPFPPKIEQAAEKIEPGVTSFQRESKKISRRAQLEVLARESLPKLPGVHIEVKEDSRRGFWIGVAVMAAMIVSAGAWWTLHNRHIAQAASLTLSPNASRSAITPPPNPTIATPPANPTSEVLAPQTTHDANSAQVITGIRHWSSPDSSTVVIDLQEQVQYEAHRLSDPERIYFDLHDVKLDPKMNRSEEIGDPLLLRLRAAELSPGIIRVVLETKPNTNFSVSLEQNPYRLVVEVRSANAKTQSRAKVDLFSPANPPIAPDAVAASTASQTSGSKVAGAGKFRVVLDAGHGGWDLGTVGRRGLLEKDLVLDIVGRLGKLVQSRLGADVVYTRTDDVYVPLEKRTEIANLAHGDLFLSVHANYSDYASARGVETYYTNTYSSVHARTPDVAGGNAPLDVSWTNVNIQEKVDDSKRFAADIQQSLYRAVTAKSAVPNRGVKEASYVVLTGSTMPAVLTEVSFVSSPTDETNLESSIYRQQLAEALYQGIAKYADSTHHVSLASASAKPAGR
jgi:N-acetylmuramoyl-L-alanine amidase/putative methionine-R-sulfoxide reductase with GAF domain